MTRCGVIVEDIREPTRDLITYRFTWIDGDERRGANVQFCMSDLALARFPASQIFIRCGQAVYDGTTTGRVLWSFASAQLSRLLEKTGVAKV